MNTTPSALVALPISLELCEDLLTTAYEGGSAYWLACEDVVRNAKGNVVEIKGCHDREDESEKFADVNLMTMQLGIQRICDPKFSIRPDIRKDLLAALTDPDSTTWDAETADSVVQAGLLGSLVYG